MLVAVRAQVMPVLPELCDGFPESRFTVKAASQKERGFNAFLLQCMGNGITAISKFIAGKYEGDLLLTGITPGDGFVLENNLLLLCWCGAPGSFIGTGVDVRLYFFLPGLALSMETGLRFCSLAASR